MFYQEKMDKVLRFGDVIKGYITTDLKIKYPILSHPSDGYNYNIDIDIPQYSVILTPCCSIEESVISITPLIKVWGKFFKNPYFEEDLTNINRRMEPKQTISESEWNEQSPEQQQERLKEEVQYALTQYFIFEENELFEPYTLRKRDIKYYMIDFKNIQTIKCDKIKQQVKDHPIDEDILTSKVLQLLIQTRKELREKLASFYGRPAMEDIEHDG